MTILVIALWVVWTAAPWVLAGVVIQMILRSLNE